MILNSLIGFWKKLIFSPRASERWEALPIGDFWRVFDFCALFIIGHVITISTF